MKNLVISSGGVIILSLVGSLKYLKEYNILKDIKSYYGISAGAILCTMLALDYTIDEITDFFISFDILKFVGDYDVTNFIDDYGFSLGENRDIIAQSIISYKLGEENKDYTFKQLYDDKKIELNIFATCVEDKTLWKFSHNSNNDVPIWKALVASSNIPFIFSPVEIDNKKFIDGAVISAYPINYVPDNEINDTLGLYIDYIYNFDFDYFKNISNLKYYIETLFLYVVNKLNYSYKNTIRISLPEEYKNYVYKFDICNEEKNKLIDIGYNITKHYFELTNNEKCKTIKPELKKSNSCKF
jgi:predicted acylesterase/phospholipase RssA